LRRLVLLHALTRDRNDFGALVAALPEFETMAVDLPGHGEARRAECYQLDHYADAVPLEERPIVYGHSLGGVVALAAAARRPGSVAALVLEDPPLFEIGGERLTASRFFRGFLKLRALLAGEASSWTLADWEHAVATWNSGHGNLTVAEAFGEVGVRRRALQLARFDPAALDATIAGTLAGGFDAAGAIRAAACRIVVLAGERARGSALDDCDLHRLVAEPGVSIVRLEGEGHFIHESLFVPCAEAVRRAAD
jgi:pimeloyl-ACP methyl ester carboxylesterase